MRPEIIALVGVLIGRIIVPVGAVCLGFWVVSRTRMGRGLFHRPRAGDEDALLLRDVVNEVEALRQELIDVQERLDFAERRMLLNTETPDTPVTPH